MTISKKSDTRILHKMKVIKVNALVKNIQYAQDHIDQETLTPFYKKNAKYIRKHVRSNSTTCYE